MTDGKVLGGGYSRVWAFEPDDKCYEMCRRNLAPLGEKVKLVKKGAWDRETVLHFCDSGANGSYGMVDESGEAGKNSVEVTSLDHYLRGEKVTFIKMDIEGAEWKALEGSREIIRAQKPKLAISLYHKIEDVWEIPSLLLELRPDYRFFLRHYTLCGPDTVLYAI